MNIEPRLLRRSKGEPGEFATSPLVGHTVPDAPVVEPETEPQPKTAPPAPRPKPSPFDPDWPEHRPEPQPKA